MMYRLRETPFTAPDIAPGTVVYDYPGCDYGLADDDTEGTGESHISVTLASNGDGPFFTVPESILDTTEDQNDPAA